MMMSGPLKLIGQFSRDGIGWSTRLKFVYSHSSVLVSLSLSIASPI